MFVIMHNKFVPFVTLNAVKGLKKIPHYIRNDKFFVQFSDLLNYSREKKIREKKKKKRKDKNEKKL